VEKELKITILFIVMLFCGCTDQRNKRIEEKSMKDASYQISERCIALLAYGLLSNDEFDIPFGGMCNDIASDTLVKYLQLQKRILMHQQYSEKHNIDSTFQISEKCIALLVYNLLSDNEPDIPIVDICNTIASDTMLSYLQLQKRIFKRWQYNSEKNTEAMTLYWEWAYKRDIGLLGSLINTRIELGWHPKWDLFLLEIESQYGDDFLFFWRLAMLGSLKIWNQREFDSLISTTHFDDIASYLDTAIFFQSVSDWCNIAEKSYNKLKLFSKNDFSKEDFLLMYYDSRCKKDDFTEPSH